MAEDSETPLAEAQSLDDQHEAAAERADLAALQAALAAGAHRQATSFELPRLIGQLHEAASTGDLAALCAALAAGAAAAVDSRNFNLSSRTALGRVVDPSNKRLTAGRRTACMRALLSAGAWASAPINANSDNSHTALHDAAYLGLSTVCRLLLDAGADVNERDGRECTPLHYAAARQNQKLIALLLSQGAVDGPSVDPGSRSPYLQKVRAAGSFVLYAKQHRAKLVAMLAPKFAHLLPPELVSVVISFWAPVGLH